MSSWLSLVEGAVLLLLAGLFLSYGPEGLKWYRLTPAMRKRYNRLPKGSLGWPLFGETLALKNSLMSTAPHSFINDRRRRYGDMFLTHLFGDPLLGSTDPEMNKYILTREDRFSTTLPKNIRSAVGENALLLLRGERHKRMRRLVIAVLSPDLLKYHAPYIKELASSILLEWKGRKVIVADEARDFTFFVILKVVLDMPRGDQSERFRSNYMELRKGARSLPIDLPGTAFRKALQARKALKEMVEGFIEERKQITKVTHFPNLLDKLMTAHETDGGPPLTIDEIIDVILSSLLAGFDTSANTLIFLIYYMGQNPQLLRDLKVEHQEILDQREPDDHLTWTDYKKMKLTQLAINETLRLANPVLSLYRVTVEDVEYKENVVPAGSSVQVWLRPTHTDPEFYPQPYAFDLDRWKDKATTNHFYPFGVGPRLCVGMELSRLELCYFIHSLVTTYSWELAECDTPKFYPAPGMRKGLPIFVKEL